MEKYFNEAVHQSKDGKPVLKLDKGYKLKTDWKLHAVDGNGRSYDPELHGEARLNDRGYLIEETKTVINSDPSTGFNETIHEQTENGDPQREEDGSIKLKSNWKELAVDRQGRAYNPKVHAEYKLDEEGYLKIRRRGESIPISSVNRTQAFVNKYREDGYAYYVMNNEGGRMEQFTQNDWEPVMTEEGQASMNVGQARSPNTQAILMKKPIEWHEADQRKKRESRDHAFKQNTSPKEEFGQYEATPLR